MGKMSRREALKGAASFAVGLPIAGTTVAGAKGKAKKLKIVVAGAHPDDPDSAAGGLMAQYTDAGHEVVALYLTRGEAGIAGKSHDETARIRTAEAEASCRILGARPVFAAQIDGATEVNRERYDEFKAVLGAEKPDLVITHWPIDSHRDHRVISVLVYDAWLGSDKSFELYYFEVEAGQQTQHFWPTHYVDITQVEARKREACLSHTSQGAEKGFYALHSEMHRFRGREAGVHLAEAYIRHNQSLTRGFPVT